MAATAAAAAEAEAAKLLVERLVGVTGDDHERFLLKIRDRFDRVGMELPAIEVRAEDLVVEAEAYARGLAEAPNIFSSITNTAIDVADTLHLLPSNWKTKHTILHKTSVLFRPRRMTLLLGPPGSGKTTLLKALAGKLDSGLKILGKITYNDREMDKFVPETIAAYVSQDDLHSGEMTVRETLAFSAKCQGIGDRYDLLMELMRREREANIMPDDDIDVFMKILGLQLCADTLVGNDMARGISGGQRKRVTIGEMLVSPAKVLLMDEISNGLDSSTAFQMVNYLGQLVRVLGGTAIISLLQPTPETFDLFDDIVLLSEGHVVYQGPKEDVVEFFQSLGFICPRRKAIADFLLEVTSRKDQKQYFSWDSEPYQYFTVEQFSYAFQTFRTGQIIKKVLEVPFDQNMTSAASLITTVKHGSRKRELFKAVFAREVLFMWRSSSCSIVNFAHITVNAIFASIIFWHSNMHHDSIADGGIYLGLLFFSVSETMFSSLGDLGGAVMKLPLFFKQRDVFYPAWTYTLSTWILKIPITVIGVTIWVAITYYAVGFDPNVGRLLKHYFLLIAVSQMSSSLFRLIAGVTRNMFVANIFQVFSILILLLLSGFIISSGKYAINSHLQYSCFHSFSFSNHIPLYSDNLNIFWMLGYWISPLMYAQNAISNNEFTAHRWSEKTRIYGVVHLTKFVLAQIPHGTKESLGTTVLKSRGLFFEAKWYWIGLSALLHLTAPGRSLSSVPRNVRDIQLKKVRNDVRSKRFHQKIVTDESSSCVNNTRVTLSFVPLSLTFENIRYLVDMPKEKKAHGDMNDRLEILKGVSGSFRPGVLTALMGISGSGKTTLMDVLAGRKTGGYTEGTINISGYEKKQEPFSRVFGYCEQSDTHSQHLTVLESLLFSAWLRLPSEVDSVTRKMFVEDLMELLELTSLHCKHVGLAGVNGLSSEQRKRLSIAVELVANPSIIFMDEPTSGLDAQAAAIVMRTVRNLVDIGKTVVCTIHQPSIDIFETFDELLLLNRDGEEIYVGQLGDHSSKMIEYFEGIEGVNRITDGYNPATWMLEVTSTVQEQMLGIDLSQIYKHSELYQTKEQDLFNSMGSMYAAVLMLGVQNASGIQPVIAMERTVFYKERAAGMYSALPYAFAQVAIELPYVFIQTLIYGTLVYTMIGFEWTITKFFWYLFFMYFTLLYFTFFGMLAVGLAPNGSMAVSVSSGFYGLWNLFSGFLIPVHRIPIWSRWCYWICPVAWTLYGLGASQFGDVMDKFETGETVAEFLRRYYGFRHEYLGVAAVVTMACAIAFAFFFVLSMKYINFQRR
ncbi:hypothetical protein U9M48_026461 [Paspalum notatum var. saurae]|uniref:ABC transporter domain-containing protein n=1 Tax=Paspalum notatum var. saurae TaxID=547442 RepID=A0AAQ3TSJ9_PASNO